MENPAPVDPAQIEYIVTSLMAVKQLQSSRLARGLAIRQLIAKQMALGTPPDHYRLQWLNRCVQKVIDCLGDIAVEFNREHPDDLCSATDFVDILNSTINTVAIFARKS